MKMSLRPSLSLIALLAVSTSQAAPTRQNTDLFPERARTLPSPLTQAEIRNMGLLRLWSQTPVVETAGQSAPSDQNPAQSKLVVNEIPEHIHGANAKVIGLAGTSVCGASRINSPKSPVSAFIGTSYAIAEEPKFDRKTEDRYKTSTSMQVGQDFSVGGWIKFYDPSLANPSSQNREYIKTMTPSMYTFMSKVKSADLARKSPSAEQRNEWELNLTPEMIYFHVLRSDQKVPYYVTRAQAEDWRVYESCLSERLRTSYQQEPAIPLKGKTKPVPVPQVPPAPGNCSSPTLPLPPVIRPPTGGGETKTVVFSFDIKKFWWAETYGSTYASTFGQGHMNDENHYESWHFINISVRMSDPVAPSVTATVVRVPLDRNGNAMQWDSRSFTQVLNSDDARAIANRLIFESDSPIQFGNGMFGGNAVNSQSQRVQRGGTYVARTALLSNQIDRLARLTYPGEGTICEKPELPLSTKARRK